MKYTTYLVHLVAVVALTGCLKVSHKNKHSVAAKPAVKSQQVEVIQPAYLPELRLDQIFIEKIGQHRPNAYDLLITWPKSKSLVRISMMNKVLFTSSLNDENYKIPDLVGGTKAFVFVEILNEKNLVVDDRTFEVDIPEDFSLTGRVLDRNIEIRYDRVFMDRTVITTQNFNLVIRAKELIILNDSRIQNFEAGAKAQPGQHGRSGGIIDIEVETAEGFLLFYLNSEAGGDGLQGYYVTKLSGGKEKQDIITQQCRDGGHGFNAGQNGNLRLKVSRDVNFYPHAEDKSYASGGHPGPKLGHAPPSYPSLAVGAPCPAQPMSGASATAGKACLLLPGRVLEKGCE